MFVSKSVRHKTNNLRNNYGKNQVPNEPPIMGLDGSQLEAVNDESGTTIEKLKKPTPKPKCGADLRKPKSGQNNKGRVGKGHVDGNANFKGPGPSLHEKVLRIKMDHIGGKIVVDLHGQGHVGDDWLGASVMNPMKEDLDFLEWARALNQTSCSPANSTVDVNTDPIARSGNEGHNYSLYIYNGCDRNTFGELLSNEEIQLALFSMGNYKAPAVTSGSGLMHYAWVLKDGTLSIVCLVEIPEECLEDPMILYVD
ncbi:hypothetical protein RJT34_04415 [Clitoria ternatea]|uniref:Uncharacterized protein n=1 Tax=Clitoria ternatea TaxID=43366 RepID=A0AAN9KKX5_CLITE